ncbi:MAG: MATE family efflux transporter [Caulobacteraceae bacterium]
MSPLSFSLWRRDLAALLRLTGPVAAARLGIMAMGLTDALVVGRYSAEQLGYLALGWTLPGVIMVGAIGFLSGVQVMTSRYIGEGRPELTGGVVRRGLRYALVMGVAAGAVIWVTGPAIRSGRRWRRRCRSFGKPRPGAGTAAASRRRGALGRRREPIRRGRRRREGR